MKSPPCVGTTCDQCFAVQQQHLITFASEGMPAVLSTPALVAFLENTARQALLPFLDPNENTVGVEIELHHLAPTPPGQTVTCKARVVRVEGPRITFQLEARDEHELVARGLHVRHVIDLDRFARVVQRKTAPR
jgi:predicted thioesterase